MRAGSPQAEEGVATEPIAILACADETEPQRMLEGVGLSVRIAAVDEIASGIASGELGLAVLCADTLAERDAAALVEGVRAQPPWSDFPFLLLGDRAALRRAGALIDDLGHVLLVERPIEPALVTNAVRIALKSRERQRAAQHDIKLRGDAEARLKQLAETLRAKVKERMGELRSTHEDLVRVAEERRVAQERLRESEELYRYTIELSQQMVWTADSEGTLRVGPRFYRLTGLPEGEPPRQAIHPQDRDRVLREWGSAIAASKPIFTEYRLRLADDSYRHFRTRAAPRRDADGRVIRWYGTIEDVEQQKRSELARIDLEERYRLAARATTDAIWDLDLATHTIEWSDSESSFFGYTADLNPTSLEWWRERIHPDDADRVSTSFDRAIEAEETHWSAHYRFLCANGEWSSVYDRGYIIRDETGAATRIVGAMSDFTERQRAEAELKRMQSELIQVSRSSAMGAMASTLAHELNQPLTAIASYVRGGLRLLDGPEANVPEVRAALEAAEAGALKAGQIVRGLRELVSRRSANMRAQDLGRIVDDANVLAFVDGPAQRVTHDVEIEPAARWVEADSIQIQQVLINLIRNAIQAMAASPRREIVIGARAAGDGMVEVSVADTGEGLSGEARAGLFSAFRSSKQEGMGIGLSISRTIVEAHGGRIWAEDRPGGGAVFRFTLPAAKAIPVKAAAKA